MSADDAVCPMHGAREPYTWGYSSKEPGCTCPTTATDDAAPTRCPRCAGANGNHGEVHVRHGNGGGHNEPCPNAPTPDDAARAEAEAEARWPAPGPGATQGEYDHAIDSQGAFEEGAEWGRADERARIVREMREYISRDESTVFAQGWNRAIEVVSARIESEVSNR